MTRRLEQLEDISGVSRGMPTESGTENVGGGFPPGHPIEQNRLKGEELAEAILNGLMAEVKLSDEELRCRLGRKLAQALETTSADVLLRAVGRGGGAKMQAIPGGFGKGYKDLFIKIQRLGVPAVSEVRLKWLREEPYSEDERVELMVLAETFWEILGEDQKELEMEGYDFRNLNRAYSEFP